MFGSHKSRAAPRPAAARRRRSNSALGSRLTDNSAAGAFIQYSACSRDDRNRGKWLDVEVRCRWDRVTRCACIVAKNCKKLHYRRGTKWCATSVEILFTAAMVYENHIWKGLAADEWPWKLLKVIGIASIRLAISHFMLVVVSNNYSIWHRFRDITTFTVYSVCDWLWLNFFRKGSQNYNPHALSDSRVSIS